MTKLIIAIQNQNLYEVKALIAQGENPNEEDEELMTPLRTACHGDPAILQYLIDHGADINQANINGNTVLSYACIFTEGDQAATVVDLLCRNNAAVHIKDFQGHSAIAKTTYQKPNLEVIKTLVKYGAYLTDLCGGGKTVFEKLKAEHPNIAKHLAADHSKLVKSQQLNEKFLDAIYEGKINLMEELFAKGADLYYMSPNGISAFYAASGVNLETMRFFLDRGVDVNAENEIGNTMLSHVAYRVKDPEEQIKMIDLLINRGANINAMNIRGETPIFKAVDSNGHIKVIKRLIEYHADLTITDHNGRTVLDTMSRFNQKNGLYEYIKSVYEQQMMEKTIGNQENKMDGINF